MPRCPIHGPSRILIVTLAMGLLPWVGTVSARAQAAQEILTPVSEIADGYDTWSLFLICSDAWTSAEHPDGPERLETLWREFGRFGRTIGRNHLAVWFWERDPRWGTDAVYEDVDVERAATFCDTYDLRPSRGPYVLVLAEYPTTDQAAAWYHKIEFAGTPLDQIEGFLTELSDILVAGDLSELSPRTESYWLALLTAIRDPFRRLSRNVTATVKTPLLDVQLTGGGSP